MFLVKEEILQCLNPFPKRLIVMGVIGDGEESWNRYNLYYYLIFKFVIMDIFGEESVIFD